MGTFVGMTPIQKPGEGLNAAVAAELRAELARERRSVQWLAEEADVPYGSVRRYLGAERHIDVAVLYALAAALDVSAVELVQRAQARMDVFWPKDVLVELDPSYPEGKPKLPERSYPTVMSKAARSESHGSEVSGRGWVWNGGRAVPVDPVAHLASVAGLEEGVRPDVRVETNWAPDDDTRVVFDVVVWGQADHPAVAFVVKSSSQRRDETARALHDHVQTREFHDPHFPNGVLSVLLASDEDCLRILRFLEERGNG